MKREITTKKKIRSGSKEAKGADAPDWRGETLARIRKLIREADPEAVEEVKWRKPSNPAGVPVWSHGGIICTGETYRDKVKMTFARGLRLRTRQGCSTQAWRAAPGGRSTSTRGTGSMGRRSRR